MEVIRGYQQKQASRQLQNFLTANATEEVIPFDQADAELAGRIAGELERIGLADPMIASIALTHGLELVTGNTAHVRHTARREEPSPCRCCTPWAACRPLNRPAVTHSASGPLRCPRSPA